MAYDPKPLQSDIWAVLCKHSDREKPPREELVSILIELLARMVLLEPRDQHAVIVETINMAITKLVEECDERPARTVLN